MKRIVYIVLFALLQGGCTTTIFVTRKVPADIIPEKIPARIAFQNRYDYLANEEIKDKHKAAYASYIEEFTKTLSAHYLPDLTFIPVPYDTTFTTDFHDQQNGKASVKTGIVAVCETANCDLLLILDHLNIGFYWETQTTEDIDGSKSKEKNFDLQSVCKLSLYTRQGNLFRATTLNSSVYYTSRPTLTGLITIVPDLSKAGDKLLSLAHKAGSEYIAMFYPGTIPETRMLYTGKMFRESNALINRQEYGKARERLTELLRFPEAKWSYKAEHNLSVATELGRIQAAEGSFP
jgi:hypothetical protein